MVEKALVLDGDNRVLHHLRDLVGFQSNRAPAKCLECAAAARYHHLRGGDELSDLRRFQIPEIVECSSMRRPYRHTDADHKELENSVHRTSRRAGGCSVDPALETVKSTLLPLCCDHQWWLS